ncbi:sulfate adenylyltransferase, large subunit [Agrilactobacillus composti DSM 18527 = JCM 14202]|uniref:Sulfate adenylyltransferase, large subunit n=1 Tax=Agrilactobacillus composti DSM 18527 = JCM 14202 TaxID=1423734 RepID=X0PLR7_9LACO|nr:GTP-binding protein [Agrilactobacillus composti]KRM30550.1 sulfate adenylyltransferase, large subunit [Agrilactobacillus composti DSM 18527 = JCM 14202]GAF38382.1 sulfate adenylyltransferase subunit 1 [Agrilactobacillus composti DSM 18527 = JCM 14202]
MNDPALHIVMVGHVDHGKSTVIGRLLYSTHALPEGTIDKVKHIAKETGKPFEYAYLLDAFEEEQKQGITIDTTQLQFQSKKRDYVIIDAPGHSEFLKNMISGASNAEVAFLIVDASRGVEEQTKRHAYILHLLGIEKIYVLINKMDLVNYEQAQFEAVKAQVGDFLKTLNVTPSGYLPLSAYYGENLLSVSKEMPWYHGQSFIDTLDGIQPKDDLDQRPLRLPIQDVFKFDDQRIIAGRIEAGTLAKGDQVTIYPSGRQTEVAGFAHWAPKDAKTKATAGQSVGVLLKDEFFNQRGEIITKTAETQRPKVTTVLQTNLFWMGSAPLETGKTYRLKIATQQVAAKVLKILKVTDAGTLKAQAKPTNVQLNDVAEVVFQLEHPLVYDFFSQQPATGRFVIVDGYDVAGGGTVTEAYAGAEVPEGTVFAADKHLYPVNLFATYRLSVGSKITATTPQAQFQLHDALPVAGPGYHYPTDFHILLPDSNRILTIRSGHFEASVDLEQDLDWSLPLVNQLGAQLHVHNPQELRTFLDEQESLNDKTKSEFYQKWLDFNVYHSILIEEL